MDGRTDGRTDGRRYGRTYKNSPLCPTGHRPFGAAAQKVPEGLYYLELFSYVLGLNYIQISNFTITGSGVPIKGVILHHLASVKLIFGARFGFCVYLYIDLPICSSDCV